jgi:signal transduction histidine kinase
MASGSTRRPRRVSKSASSEPTRAVRRPASLRAERSKSEKPKKTETSQRKPGRDPLLSAICHDLRAPLAAVTMGANFVLQTLDEGEGDTRSRKILEAMLRSCTQMERLVRNFADLSEIDGNAVHLRIGTHDAGEMLELAAQAAGEAARARSITIEIDRPATNVHVACDRERMLRSLHHLLDNAIKHAPEASTITLSVTLRGDDVTFSVVDRGDGLSAQTRRNLFDRHWHAKRANRVGAGFGLAIARGFAHAHHGKLSVDSRPGNTMFSIVIPRGDSESISSERDPRR